MDAASPNTLQLGEGRPIRQTIGRYSCLRYHRVWQHTAWRLLTTTSPRTRSGTDHLSRRRYDGLAGYSPASDRTVHEPRAPSATYSFLRSARRSPRPRQWGAVVVLGRHADSPMAWPSIRSRQAVVPTICDGGRDLRSRIEDGHHRPPATPPTSIRPSTRPRADRDGPVVRRLGSTQRDEQPV